MNSSASTILLAAANESEAANSAVVSVRVFPTATPYFVAALTSTLLYPTAMLLNALPPALLSAEKSVSPQSSVN
nr:hypothetical protein Iba_scaffold20569CG0010 [Ipomoea batatas]